MELFHSVAASTIRNRHDDLAFSALPDAPVQPFEPRQARSSRARRARAAHDRSNGLLTVLARLRNRPTPAECTNVHSPA